MMTLEEFFKQPAPVVGAVAALLVALISALTVIVGALVNARSAKIVARDTFRRELLFENLKPFLKRLNETIVTLQAIIDAGPAVAGGLDEVGRAAPDERKGRIE